jgi:hypothetical protein
LRLGGRGGPNFSGREMHVKASHIAGAVIAGLLSVNAVQAAVTIPLVYENGPNVGKAYTGGPLTIQVTSYEVGTLYNPTLAQGTQLGYSGAPSAAGYQTGISTLDGLAVSTPANAQARGQYPGLNGNQEDGWGILEVNNIKDANGFNLFTPAGKGEQLTAIFYGEQDFSLTQSTASMQNYSGVGLQADFYLSPLQNFDPTGGTALRNSSNGYPTVTDGQFVMHVGSVPGFINAPGQFGGTATEFQSSYDYADGTGRGQAFADVAPGTPEYSILHTGDFTSSYGFGDADLNFTYTDGPSATPDWLVQANDPIKGNAVVPEPASLSMIAVIGAGLLGRRKRR